MTPLYVVALKAFGDFVIALSVVRRALATANLPPPKMLAGYHLKALASSIGAVQTVRFIGDDTWLDVPPAFDVNRHGKIAAVRSLLDLRRRLASVNGESAFVFDRLGWREQFVVGRHTLVGIPRDSGNIYLAYEQLLEGMGYEIEAEDEIPPLRTIRRAVIVPGSRIARKTVPANVIASINAELGKSSILSTVITLEGEAVEVPPGLKSLVLPRNFDALVTTLKSADMVVSADSLSAHLGEYHRLPTFVSTPSSNRYWLPQSAYHHNGWGTFEDPDSFPRWLERHSSRFSSIRPRSYVG